MHLHPPYPSEYGVTRVWTPKCVGDDPNGGDTPLEDALTIDEVDVKRRSVDCSIASLNNHHVPPSATVDAESDDEDVSHESTDLPALDPPLSIALLQEDEDMLFPLPSPRRTPNHSPIPTPTGSQVSLSTLYPGNLTNGGLSDSQTALATPVISSPLASQDSEPLGSVPSSPARSPLIPVSPVESAPEQSSLRSLPSSPVHIPQPSSLPETRRVPLPRRSSFSTVSETFFRGSTSVLKGVAASMKAGAGGAVIH